jgi:hypothetical protein
MAENKEPTCPNPFIGKFIDWCGGPTEATFRLRVSSATIHDWKKAGFFRDREKAIEAAVMCGWLVTPAQLLGVPEAPASELPDPEKRGPKDKSPRSIAPAPQVMQPAGGGTEAGREARAEARSGRRKVASRHTPTPPSCWSRSATGRSVAPGFREGAAREWCGGSHGVEQGRAGHR